jgi:hypothetical protein
MQGVALVSGFACCFEARRCALKVVKTEEFEAIQEAAITADMVDEIATSAYVSEQQRRQEAELILINPDLDMEASRQSLEAIYTSDLQDGASTSDNPSYLLYLEVCKSREVGKSNTWIVENVLKMGGRKFADGKAKLESILKQFEEK